MREVGTESSAGPDGRESAPWGLAVGIGAVALAFAVYFVGDIMLSVVAHAVDPTALTHQYLEFTAIGYQFLTLGVLIGALVFVLGRYALTPAALGYRFPGWTALGAAALAYIPVALAGALIANALNHVLPGAPIHGNTQNVFPSNSLHIVPWERILIFLFVAIEVPLTEETLFRGILFQGARTFFHRWFPYEVAVASAALLSGTLFGFAHLADPRDIHTLPVLIFLGVVLAYAFQRARSIYASALIHGLNNGIAIFAVFASLH